MLILCPKGQSLHNYNENAFDNCKDARTASHLSVAPFYVPGSKYILMHMDSCLNNKSYIFYYATGGDRKIRHLTQESILNNACQQSRTILTLKIKTEIDIYFQKIPWHIPVNNSLHRLDCIFWKEQMFILADELHDSFSLAHTHSTTQPAAPCCRAIEHGPIQRANKFSCGK